jgi:hypothetical protein
MLTAFCLSFLVLAEVCLAELSVKFMDVTSQAGIQFNHISGDRVGKKYLFEAKGGGVAFFDYDNDGWLDLYIVQGSTLELLKNGESPGGVLYRNQGDGTFKDVTAESGLRPVGWGMGVATADFNNDGFVDLYLTSLTENALYQNNGDGTFTDISQLSGVATPRWSASAAFGDYDLDGDLDLYVANYVLVYLENLVEPGSLPICKYKGIPEMCGPMGLKALPNTLYRNDGEGTFTEMTNESGVGNVGYYYSLGVIWADLDNDRDPDLVVSNDSTRNQVFINQGDGTFKDRGFLSGLAASADGLFQASMGVDAADYDNDGLLDVFMTHFANDYSTLYHNRGNLLFEDVTNKAGLLQPEWLLVSWGTRFVDFDHDGWKDIFHSNGHVYSFLIDIGWAERYAQASSVYLNRENGTFRDVSSEAGEALQVEKASRGVAFGDYDNDGDIDMVISNLNDSPQLLRNDSVGSGHWVMFRLRGDTSNRDGIGARLTIESGGLRQIWEIKRTVGIYSASDPRAHFGLGNSTRINRVEIWWPSGKSKVFEDVPADTHYVITENGQIEKEF